MGFGIFFFIYLVKVGVHLIDKITQIGITAGHMYKVCFCDCPDWRGMIVVEHVFWLLHI